MNELQIFENPEFGRIRAVEKDGEPWFVASDVCKALELGETHVAMRRLDDDEKDRYLIPTPGGNQESSIVNEPGLYSLVLGSRKPEAKAFKRWITHEVIPSIRKTGGYTAPASKELQAIFMLDNRTVQHEQRIAALEDTMVVDYGQQRTLTNQVNAVVISALGGSDSPAYHDKHVRGKVYSECNRDIQNWFRVNSRNNVPRKRFDEAVEYIRRWRPSTNMSMTIRQTNGKVF